MGAATAAAMAGRGRRLLLADRDLDAVAKIADEIGAEAIQCDLSDPDSIMRLAAEVGRLGSLVVTAGVSGPPGEVTLTINLLGYARLLEALDAAIGEGSAIVLFASMVELFPAAPEVVTVLDEPLAPDFFDRLRGVGVDPTDPGMGYVYSKVGVVRLVRTRAHRYWQRGARIVSISPGVIDTPLLGLTIDTPVVQQMKSVVRRFGQPDEVGRVAAFFASDSASYVTGINVSVDGGYQTMVSEDPALAQANHAAREATAQEQEAGR